MSRTIQIASCLVLLCCATLVGQQWPLRLGTWSQTVKTDIDGHDDDARMLRALRDTGQNFVIYSVNSQDELDDLVLLLQEAAGTDMRIFAGVSSWTTSCSGNMWLERVAGTAPLPGTGCDCNGYGALVDYTQCKDAWLAAWKQAARELGVLSVSYQNLVGMVIDDFGQLVESADEPACLYGDRLTRAEVGRIWYATKLHNPAFELWATCYPANFGRVIGEGYILGANNGVKLLDDSDGGDVEDMIVRLSFPLPEWPGEATLSFFHNDTISDGRHAASMIKEVRVNGTSVCTESVLGDQHIQRFEQDIAAHLHPLAGNWIELRLAPQDGDHNGCGQVFWRVWDVRLAVGFGSASSRPPLTITTFNERFDVNPRSDGYDASCGGRGFSEHAWISNVDPRCTPPLPNHPVLGRMAQRLIAAPNRGFLIHDFVDGIVAPDYRTLQSDPIEDCAGSGIDVQEYSFDPVLFAQYLKATKRHLRLAKLMQLGLGMGGGSTFLDTSALAEQLEIGASIADYVGVWNHPLAVHYLHPPDRHGVFKEHESDVGDYAFMGFWPSRQRTLSGWYHRWTSSPNLAGTQVKVYVDDTRESADGSAGILRKSVFAAGVIDSSGATIDLDWSEDVADPQVPDADNVLGPFTLGQDPLILTMALVGEVGNQGTKVYFDVREVTSSGEVSVERGDWTFESGVNETTHDVIDPYTVVRDTYLGLRRYRTFQPSCGTEAWLVYREAASATPGVRDVTLEVHAPAHPHTPCVLYLGAPALAPVPIPGSPCFLWVTGALQLAVTTDASRTYTLGPLPVPTATSLAGIAAQVVLLDAGSFRVSTSIEIQ